MEGRSRSAERCEACGGTSIGASVGEGGDDNRAEGNALDKVTAVQRQLDNTSIVDHG